MLSRHHLSAIYWIFISRLFDWTLQIAISVWIELHLSIFIHQDVSLSLSRLMQTHGELTVLHFK